MAHINKTLIYFVLFLTLFFSSCLKKDTKIPTGNHSFSCYVDGELFLPKPYFDWYKPNSDGLLISNSYSYITARANDHEKYLITFNVTDSTSNIAMLGETESDIYNTWTDFASLSTNGTVYFTKENSGFVEFTEYSDTNIIGIFEFTLYNKDDSTDIIHVTDGHFNN